MKQYTEMDELPMEDVVEKKLAESPEIHIINHQGHILSKESIKAEGSESFKARDYHLVYFENAYYIACPKNLFLVRQRYFFF